MSSPANPHRGDTAFNVGQHRYVLRPTFTAITAAEQTLGPLVALAGRAERGLSVSELAVLFHHCHAAIESDGPSIEAFGELILQAGLAEALGCFKQLMQTILHGEPG